MKKTLKQISMVVAGACALLVFTGCGSEDTATDDAAPAAPESAPVGEVQKGGSMQETSTD